MSKIMNRRDGGHVDEPGDHEEVGISEKFLFYLAWCNRSFLMPNSDLNVLRSKV